MVATSPEIRQVSETASGYTILLRTEGSQKIVGNSSSFIIPIIGINRFGIPGVGYILPSGERKVQSLQVPLEAVCAVRTLEGIRRLGEFSPESIPSIMGAVSPDSKMSSEEIIKMFGSKGGNDLIQIRSEKINPDVVESLVTRLNRLGIEVSEEELAREKDKAFGFSFSTREILEDKTVKDKTSSRILDLFTFFSRRKIPQVS